MYRRSISQEKANLESKIKEKNYAKNKITEFVSELNYAEQGKKQNMQSKNNKLSNLGRKPDAETKYRTETHREKRSGFFGGIVNFFCGDKIVKEEVAYKDYSKQREWERKKNEIETEFAEKDSQLRTQINYLQSKYDEIKSNIQNIENLEVRKQKDIRLMEETLKNKKIFLEDAKKKATSEYIARLIRDIHSQLNNYLFHQDNNIKDNLVDNFEQLNKQNKEQMIKIIEETYYFSFNQRIESLENLLNNSEKNNTTLKTDEIILEINDTINKLEVIKCQI